MLTNAVWNVLGAPGGGVSAVPAFDFYVRYARRKQFIIHANISPSVHDKFSHYRCTGKPPAGRLGGIKGRGSTCAHSFCGEGSRGCRQSLTPGRQEAPSETPEGTGDAASRTPAMGMKGEIGGSLFAVGRRQGSGEWRTTPGRGFGIEGMGAAPPNPREHKSDERRRRRHSCSEFHTDEKGSEHQDKARSPFQQKRRNSCQIILTR